MNLNWVSALLVDPDQYSVKLVSRMLEEFGMVNQTIVGTGEAAKTVLEQELFDVIICEAVLPGLSSGDLTRWLRRLEANPLRLIPVVVLAGYTQRSIVESSRDAGVNVVVKRPFSYAVLYDRLKWVYEGGRLFVESATYSGPDRRFKNAGLPGGIGRRSTDLTGDIGDPSAPNMSQDETDMLIKPMEVEI